MNHNLRNGHYPAKLASQIPLQIYKLPSEDRLLYTHKHTHTHTHMHTHMRASAHTLTHALTDITLALQLTNPKAHVQTFTGSTGFIARTSSK